jgi:hypothetical protein
MQTSLSSSRILAVAILVVCAFMPLVLHAQTATSSALSAAIRAELLSDPRSASLSEAQLSAMVDLLSQEAQKQGLTAQDIQWHPNPPATGYAAPGAVADSGPVCDGSLTCLMDEAFGFVGPDTTISFLLGMSSMGLIWILAEMIHRHKYPHITVPPVSTSGM